MTLVSGPEITDLHGSGEMAIEWGLENLHPLNECIAIFLKNWMNDKLDEYPEYLEWVLNEYKNRLI